MDSIDNIVANYGFQFSSATGAAPVLSRAQTCFKSTLIIVNMLFLIFGCVLAAVGSYALNSNAGALAGSTLPQGIIVLGVFILFVSLLGCLAAWRESRLFLGIYFLLLLLFTIILLGVGIAVYAQKDDALLYIRRGWINASNGVRSDIQKTFGCCGLDRWNDSYAGYPCLTPGTVNDSGCLGTISNVFATTYMQAGACGIAFAIVMGAGMAFVCILMAGIKDKEQIENVRKVHKHIREAKSDGTATSEYGEEEEVAQDVDQEHPHDLHDINLQGDSGYEGQYGGETAEYDMSNIEYSHSYESGAYDAQTYDTQYSEYAADQGATGYDQGYGDYANEGGHTDEYGQHEQTQRRDSIDEM